MGFLDNLENAVKAEEARASRDPETARREAEAREAARAAAAAAAPFAEALKTSPFVNQLLGECRTLGHASRTLVRMSWIDRTVRFEAKDRKLDLVPGAQGITAVFPGGSEPLDLATADPKAFAARFLAGL